MLKKFIGWFVIFGLSFLVQDVFHWTEQGKAFFYINFSWDVIFALITIVGFLSVTIHLPKGLRAIPLLEAVKAMTTVAIVLFATWVASKLFDVNFYVAYQMMTFGQCLCTETKQEHKTTTNKKKNP